ncbi:MAG: OmpA family protein [Bacteroidaceae bacterium]|nr:OmpA family protein [Bacteroidaceae bacterium]
MKKILTLLFAVFAVSMATQAQVSKDQEIEALKKQIAEKQLIIRMHQQGNLVPYVHFDKNSATITNTYDASLEMLATYIKKHPNAVIEVRSYASDDETNVKALCEARAKAVIAKLTNVYKVKPAQFRTIIVGQGAKIYEQQEFNRIVTFNDNNKK